jgi:hypothetical protein
MANNLRVVYNNAADRATLTASSTAGTCVVTNLQSDFKSEVWRSNTTTETVTMTWAVGEIIGMVALAFCSLSSAATFRIKAYNLSTDSTPAYDATKLCCPASMFDAFYWGTEPLGVNAYSYGGATYAVAWIPPNAYQKIELVITDSNPLGYIEASRLVCGTYWSPTYTAEMGAAVGVVDNSKQERTDAGDLRTDRGTVHKTLNFDLNFLTQQDRNSLYNIIVGNGLFRPLYVSLLPEETSDQDQIGEQVFQIYGKMSRQGSIKYQFVNQFSTQLELEEL